MSSNKLGKKQDADFRGFTRINSTPQEEMSNLFQDIDLVATCEYMLANAAYRHLPEILKRDWGIVVKGRLTRQYVKDNTGKEVEVNIIGKGMKDDEELMVIGESKAQLSKNNVDDFMRIGLTQVQNNFTAEGAESAEFSE